MAQLQGASFVDVCVWRAEARQAAWKDTRVARAHPKCDWNADSFTELKQLIAKDVPEEFARRFATERIEHRLDPVKALEGEDEMAKIWAAREREAPTPEVYEKSLAETDCAAEGAPYVLHALIDRLSSPVSSPFRDQSDTAKALAAAFPDEAHCPGGRGLSDADKAALKEIGSRLMPPMQGGKYGLAK